MPATAEALDAATIRTTAEWFKRTTANVRALRSAQRHEDVRRLSITSLLAAMREHAAVHGWSLDLLFGDAIAELQAELT